MSRTDRRRHRARPVAEALKSVLIVILAASALYLTALAISAGTPGGGSPAGLLEQLRSALAGDQGEGEPVQTGQPAMAARPVRMAVVNSQGRYAAEYDAALTDQLFDQLAGLLSEALASAQAPRQVDRSAWRQALCEPGVYFDLLGDVPLDALYAWLGEGGSNPSLPGAAVRRLAVVREGENTALYYCSQEDGRYYACSTALAYPGHMENTLEAYSPNGAIFAFQSEQEGLESLGGDMLLTAQAPSPRGYRGTNPFALGDSVQVERLQQALGFRVQESSVYEIPGGVRVREGQETLEVQSSGIVRYHAAQTSASRYQVEGESSAALIEAARALAQSTLGESCGAARLYLDSLERQEDGSWTVRFGYCLDGAAVDVAATGWAAEFTVEEGYITGYTLHFRSYEETGQRVSQLPLAQAAAALEALDGAGRELLVCYTDSGETVTAGWTAE